MVQFSRIALISLTMLYLAPERSTTSSLTQQDMVVVQSMHQTALYLLSVEPTTSSATQQVLMVAQSTHMTTLHFGSMEQTTSSITQQVFWVVQSTHQTTLHLFSLEPKLHQQLSRCLGGGIYTLNNAVLTFNGTSNFTNNSAGISSGGAIYTPQTMLYLVSMESTTSSTIQQMFWVVQSTHHKMLYLTSAKSQIISTAQWAMVVVQFFHQATLYLVSMEPAAMSTTQQVRKSGGAIVTL